MTRRDRRRWEGMGFIEPVLTDEERDKRLIDEMMEKIEIARAFQAEQVRRGIEPEPITVSSEWEAF